MTRRIALLLLTVAWPGLLHAEWAWVSGHEDLAGDRRNAERLDACLRSAIDPRDCVGTVSLACARSFHTDRCFTPELLAWQVLGQDHLETSSEAAPGLAPLLHESQAFWLGYVGAHCRGEAEVSRGEPAMSRLIRAYCLQGLTVDRVLELRGALTNLRDRSLR